MMRLLRSWRDSLLLLAPQNFKLFALVTLKSTFETYKVLARVWYIWLIPVVAPMMLHLYLTSLGSVNLVLYFNSLSSFRLLIFFVGMKLWLSMMICLATRPSIRQKDFNYFTKYIEYFFILLFILVLNTFIGIVLPQIAFFSNSGLSDYFNPLWIFLILFFLDSNGSIKSFFCAFIRAIKMTIYNLPLLALPCLLVFMVLVPIFSKYMILYKWKGYIWSLFSMVLLEPLIINIWTNIYIKKLHETPDLYFKQPK